MPVLLVLPNAKQTVSKINFVSNIKPTFLAIAFSCFSLIFFVVNGEEALFSQLSRCFSRPLRFILAFNICQCGDED